MLSVVLNVLKAVSSNLLYLVETAFEVNQSFSKIWNKICDKLDPAFL